MKRTLLYIGLAGCLLASGCAQKETAPTGTAAQDYLNLWLQEYQPGAVKSASGVYILEDIPGTGAAWDGNLAYSLLNVTIKSLNGKVTSTGHEEMAKQLGTYATGNYYGPSVTATEYGYAGVEALLTGMRYGGTRTAVVPSWLLTTDRYDTQQEYLEACTSTTHMIYTITLSGQMEDVAEWEQDNLRTYVTENFGPSVYPISFNDETAEADLFYFVSDISGFQPADTIATGTSYKLNYTGRLLNGQVFDTTLEKVAKDNGIFDSSKTYEPVTIKTASGYDSYTLDGSSSLVTGFKGALSMIKYPGQKGVALFTSDLGYTTNGSGSKIPGYASLRFDLEVVSIIESD